MPQISTEDSGINSKTNNNIVGYHLFLKYVD